MATKKKTKLVTTVKIADEEYAILDRSTFSLCAKTIWIVRTICLRNFPLTLFIIIHVVKTNVFTFAMIILKRWAKGRHVCLNSLIISASLEFFFKSRNRVIWHRRNQNKFVIWQSWRRQRELHQTFGRFFEYVETKAKCKICSQTLSRGTNLSKLSNRSMLHHIRKYPEAQKEKEIKDNEAARKKRKFEEDMKHLEPSKKARLAQPTIESLRSKTELWNKRWKGPTSNNVDR